MNHAHAPEGALLGVHWTNVPAEVKPGQRRFLGKEHR